MRRFWTFGVVVALVTGGSALPAVAHGGGHVPDDQPLAGYTVTNPPLAPLTVAGGTTTVLQGVFHHAAYDIEIPPKWNGDLVMYAHGYRGQGTVLTVDPPPFGLRAEGDRRRVRVGGVVVLRQRLRRARRRALDPRPRRGAALAGG